MLTAAPAFAAPAPPAPSGPPPVMRVGDAFYPAYARLVLQSQSLAGQDIAAWTWDDKFVVTANAIGRTVLVWDVATGRIVNKIAFPILATADFVEPYELDIDKAGLLTLRVNLRTVETGFCRNAVFRYPLAKAGVWNTKISDDAAAPCLEDGSDTEFPKSHDGRLALTSAGYPGGKGFLAGVVEDLRNTGIRVIDDKGRTLQTLHKPPPLSFRHAALSPDGHTMALIVDDAPIGMISLFATQAGLPAADHSKVLLFDIATSTYLKPVEVPGFYSRVAWLDAKRVLLTENYASNARGERQDEAADPRRPTPARVVDIATGKDAAPPIADHCYVVPLTGDALVGAGLANCWDDPKGEHGVMRYDPDKGWRTLDDADFKRRDVIRIAPSPDGTRVAVLAEAQAAVELLLLDAATGAVVARTPLPEYETSAQLGYAPDGKSIVATLDNRYHAWTPGSPPAEVPDSKPPPLPFPQSSVEFLGQHWYEYNEGDQQVSSIDLRASSTRSILMFGNVVAAGLMPDTPVFWAVTSIDGIKFWPASLNAGSGRFATISTWLIPGDHYFTLAPDRRYDSDLGADTDQFRWLVTDSGFESLGPQTFMRDYFEPRLAPRALECIRADTCETAFKSIPTVVMLNRALPKVTIAGVAAGPTPDIAIVDIVATPGHKPDAKYGKTDSPIYDLRLFRNGSLVARAPGTEDRAGVPVSEWRAANLVPLGPDGAAHVRLTVRLPTAAAAKDVVFTAYSFNEDRIKSETASYTYTRPGMTLRPPRAFVVTIGIDAYDDLRLRLHFSARDAELVAERLKAIPGFAARDVHQLVLTGQLDANGKPSRVLRETIAAALGILGGAPRESALKALRDAGFDGSALDAARPDDTVILSFAGHGWADKQGGFFLIPSDGRAIDPAKPVDTSRFVSAIDLTNWLRPVDAGEIALIIDACNSAASVEAGGFKPGPMGDANLGQLAFDKGLRILAATQSADLALEDDKLGHGLLTYALAAEGIDDAGFGRADRNGDGAITLDEWLRYATERLPGLSEDVRLKRYASLAARDFNLVPLVPTAKPKPQEPALFDFTGRPSPVVLRRKTP